MASVLTTTSTEVVLGHIATPAKDLVVQVEDAFAQERSELLVNGPTTAELSSLSRTIAFDMVNGQVGGIGGSAADAPTSIAVNNLLTETPVIGQSFSCSLLWIFASPLHLRRDSGFWVGFIARFGSRLSALPKLLVCCVSPVLVCQLLSVLLWSQVRILLSRMSLGFLSVRRIVRISFIGVATSRCSLSFFSLFVIHDRSLTVALDGRG